MKKMIFMFPVLFILSCTPEFVELPTSQEKKLLNLMERSSISSLIDKVTAEEDTVEIITPGSFSHEQFELLKYLVPLLHDRQKLDMGFWFLKGNSDEDILQYLQSSDGAPGASELLFKSDPVLCGYREYVDFLEYLKDFYSQIDDPEQMRITGTDVSYVYVSLFNRRSDTSDRIRFLIHAPLSLGDNRWQLPFAGKIYYMMIHEWNLDQFSGIKMNESVLGDQYLTSDNRENQQKASRQIDYILLAGIEDSYTDFLPIESFINESNITEALNYFPGQIIREKVKPAIYFVNKKIMKIHRKAGKELNKEYLKVLEMFPVSR